ncbi:MULTISPECIES: polyphosphate kinase 2 family protein [unclassified Ruegeria]|jgi:polyphosphate kinase 2 (PPK2 family)|uniref:polyphosphate kinase 2 family protein n=1 Tax=unclassified Ruegeria TaxID=2625375 RepID=UPI0012686048|nr:MULTISPECIES: polyphosphate kinase [unclassified Ruegeria]NOC82443.1 polyphosphate kinase [Ruegeria sp. HKCCD6428]NOE25890.1 polyphosphate kinase [Ruegeria sp. HKCCD6157]QFT72955.1 Polyphosphate kinase 2 (PPK2) [Ruegeria sp. THAF33]
MSKHHPPKLSDADLTRKLNKKVYFDQLIELQTRLARIQQAYLFHGLKGVLVFEGWDAAGKGGTIRRISQALDPRSFKVWPIGAPRNYYLNRHYLLRFWERLPPSGAISAFDRSWYGRVLVERIEKLTPETRWRAAYQEINDFERMLVDDGTRIVKLFFHISQEEQMRRFTERLTNPMKRWKLTYEDFRNREKWDVAEVAVDEMLARTSTEVAPWHVIPSNNKKYARITAMKAIVEAFSEGVDLNPQHLDRRTLEAAGKTLAVDQSLIDSLRARTE